MSIGAGYGNNEFLLMILLDGLGKEITKMTVLG